MADAILIALIIGEHKTGSDYLRTTGGWAWWCRCNARGTAPDALGADRAMDAHVAEQIAVAIDQAAAAEALQPS